MTRQFVVLTHTDQPDIEELRANKEAADKALAEAEREARFAERFFSDPTHWMVLNVNPTAGPIRTIMATLQDQINDMFSMDGLGYSVEISLTEPDLPAEAPSDIEEARDDA